MLEGSVGCYSPISRLNEIRDFYPHKIVHGMKCDYDGESRGPDISKLKESSLSIAPPIFKPTSARLSKMSK